MESVAVDLWLTLFRTFILLNFTLLYLGISKVQTCFDPSYMSTYNPCGGMHYLPRGVFKAEYEDWLLEPCNVNIVLALECNLDLLGSNHHPGLSITDQLPYRCILK